MKGIKENLSHLWNAMMGWLRFFYPYRRLRFTREGWFFSILALSIGLIAINTGHNLFFLVFGLLLGMVIVSGLLSERVLRGIVVTRHAPSEATARVPFAVVLEVCNSHRQKISYSLMIRDAGSFFAPRNLGYIPYLRPGETKSFHYLTQVDKRGLYSFGPVHLVTRFPFGLFEKIRIIPLSQRLITYPGQRDTSSIRAQVSGKEQTGIRKRRWGEEILGLRPAVIEDDHRIIHWRTSARMGQLMVKEFVEEIEQPRPLFFDNRGEEGESFELAVEVAASLLRSLSSQGVPVSLAIWEDHIEPIADQSQLEAGLRLLALVTPFSGSIQFGESGKTGNVGKEGKSGFEQWRSEVLREGGGIYLHGAGVTPASLPPCEVVKV